jgi:hypothetical protein
MKTPIIIILFLFLSKSLMAQVSFSQVEYKLDKSTDETGTNLVCKASSFSAKFRLKSKAVELSDNVGFVTIDSQLIQITPLKVDGAKKSLDSLTDSEKKDFLSEYSKYELDYFTNDLKIEVINPNSQWVDANSNKWLVWYFRVGKAPATPAIKMEIQLFASTIIGSQVLTLNAPVKKDGDFRNAALTVNQLMESLTVK